MSLPEEQIEQLFVPGGAGAKKRIAAR